MPRRSPSFKFYNIGREKTGKPVASPSLRSTAESQLEPAMVSGKENIRIGAVRNIKGLKHTVIGPDKTGRAPVADKTKSNSSRISEVAPDRGLTASASDEQPKIPAPRDIEVYRDQDPEVVPQPVRLFNRLSKVDAQDWTYAASVKAKHDEIWEKNSFQALLNDWNIKDYPIWPEDRAAINPRYTLPAPPDAATPPHPESRDCPSEIINVEHAIRWQYVKELKDPLTTLEENTRRSRKDVRVKTAKNRRYKKPIMALMMNASQTTKYGSNPPLENQDHLRFCQFKSVATPLEVDFSLMGNIELTLLETLAYAPNHTQVPLMADRCLRAGLTTTTTAMAINTLRSLEGDSMLSVAKVLYHTRHADTQLYGELKTAKTRTKAPVTDLTAANWDYLHPLRKVNEVKKIDYPLLALSYGLTQQLTGANAGPLTQLMAWVRERGRFHVKVSDVAALLAEAGISTRVERPADGTHPDVAAVEGLQEAIRTYRDTHAVKIPQKKKAAAMEAEPQQLVVEDGALAPTEGIRNGTMGDLQQGLMDHARPAEAGYDSEQDGDHESVDSSDWYAFQRDGVQVQNMAMESDERGPMEDVQGADLAHDAEQDGELDGSELDGDHESVDLDEWYSYA